MFQGSRAHEYFAKLRSRDRIVSMITQPMTATQIASRLDMDADSISWALRSLYNDGLVTLLNPLARQSRLFWLTSSGFARQERLRSSLGLPIAVHDLPHIDWSKYGFVCYRHRSVIVKVLRDPLQPSEIKRVARREFENVRMSANNVRDAIRLLREKEIVLPIVEHKHAFPRYQLAPRCQDFRRLLLQASTTGIM